MRRRSGLWVLVALAVASGPAYGAPAPQDSPKAAAAAVAASPELVGALATQLGSTQEQAAGAAGSLFGVAKSRLKPEEFAQIATAVPGMNALLKAAPSAGAIGTTGLPASASSAAGLASAASAFSTLGLKPEMVSKAIPVLTQFVTKSGGAQVGSLLAGALK